MHVLIIHVMILMDLVTLDWDQVFKTAHENGGDVHVTCRGETYTVFTVDALRDDTDNFHHWEIGLR